MSVFRTGMGVWVGAVSVKQKCSRKLLADLCFHLIGQRNQMATRPHKAAGKRQSQPFQLLQWRDVKEKELEIDVELLKKKKNRHTPRQEKVRRSRQTGGGNSSMEESGTSPSLLQAVCPLEFFICLFSSQTCDCTGTTHLPTDTGLAA